MRIPRRRVTACYCNYCRAALQLIIFRSERRLEGRSDSFAQVMYRAMDDAMYTTRGEGMSPEGADNALKGAHNRVKGTDNPGKATDNALKGARNRVKDTQRSA